MTCISTITTDLCAPVEPVIFHSCDGPHSGTPDDQRPPHWIDAVDAGLVVLWWGYDRLERVAEDVADAWAGYGFTAADLSAWVAVGITEPSIAAECRTAGFNPHEPADCSFILSFVGGDGAEPWCEALDCGDVSPDEAMAAYKGAP